MSGWGRRGVGSTSEPGGGKRGEKSESEQDTPGGRGPQGGRAKAAASSAWDKVMGDR